MGVSTNREREKLIKTLCQEKWHWSKVALGVLVFTNPSLVGPLAIVHWKITRPQRPQWIPSATAEPE
jgi:hypothetical protein